jgi:hypothetical protein
VSATPGRPLVGWLLAAAFTALAPSAAGQEQVSFWTPVPVPGGVAGLRRLLGDSLRSELLFVQAARRLEAAGITGGARLREDLARSLDTPAGGPPGTDGDDAPEHEADVAPLPLAPELWSSAVFGRPVGADTLAREVLADRRALLLAHGLAGLDPPTLSWIGARPALLRFLYDGHAPAFAAFGRSLRVADGRLALPGGGEARGTWADLAGTDPGDAERFARALVSRDEGRLAWFYDTVAHLDPAQARHVIGVSAADARSGRERARRLARVFALVARREWRTTEAPFGRPRVDPAILLRELSMNPDGTLGGPTGRSFWGRAFERPEPAGRDRRAPRPAPDGAADAADLVEHVFAQGAWSARDRFVAVLFAQRVFPRVADQDAADVLAAVQGVTAFPAVMLTVERLAITDSGLHAAVAREAAAVDAVADAGRRTRAIIEFQGALALVESLAASGSLGAPVAHELVAALCAPKTSPARVGGAGVARWVRDALLPSLPPLPVPPDGPAADRPAEQRLLAALAGVPLAGTAPLVVDWEGERHVVDLARGRLRRLQRVRAAQATPPLDVALRLLRASEAAEAVASGTPGAENGTGASDEDLDALPEGVLRELGVEGAAPETVRRVRAALASAEPADRAGKARVLSRAVMTLADAVLADALRALVYAAAVAASDDDGLRTGDLARRHDFGFDLAPPPVRERAPWTLPRVRLGGDRPWRLSGALLGLDLALAVDRLPRVESDAPPRRQRLNDMVKLVLAQHAMTSARHPPADLDAAAIAATLEDGTRRVAALAAGTEPFEDVTRGAGLGEWRREAIRWLVRTRPSQVPDAFSLDERFRLGVAGRAPSTPPVLLMPEAVSGSLLPRPPAGVPWEELAGHSGTGMVAAEFADIPLRLSSLLAHAGFRSALLPALVPFATRDVVVGTRATDADDWFALLDAVARLDPARLDDYLAVLSGDGSLTPATGLEGPR